MKTDRKSMHAKTNVGFCHFIKQSLRNRAAAGPINTVGAVKGLAVAQQQHTAGSHFDNKPEASSSQCSYITKTTCFKVCASATQRWCSDVRNRTAGGQSSHCTAVIQVIPGFLRLVVPQRCGILGSDWSINFLKELQL